MSFSDLAGCSKWGRNKAIERSWKDKPLQLLSPVLTAPYIMHQGVAGMLYGQLTRSAANVEAVLVLANAVGLGDHLGLSELFDDAVDALIPKPWVDNMHRIAQIVAMPMFQQDIAKIDALLHHPRRGAYTELQVLELLEMADMSLNSIAAVLKMDTMQPAELDTLLGILVNTKYAPTAGVLLCKAVQQHRLLRRLTTMSRMVSFWE